MAQYCFSITGGDFVAEYTARVTFEGSPAKGPTYSHGGLPADDPEFEITVTSLRFDVPTSNPYAKDALEMPAWLREQIETAISEDPSSVVAILAEHRERKEYERDEAADRKREAMRDEPEYFGGYSDE